MVWEFLKPNKWKMSLTIVLLIFTLFLVYMVMAVGLRNSLLPVLVVLGLPLSFTIMGSTILAVVAGIIIELLWLYLVSCVIMLIFIFIKDKLLLIRWDRKKITILAIVIFLSSFSYGFYYYGLSDAFISTADDSGATVQGIREIARANNHFAIDLYSEITNDTDKNIFFSPFSISTAVAMLYEGARGKTKEEIRGVFYFPEDDMLRRSSYASLLNTLNKAWGKYKLSIADAIWLQKDYPFLEEYKDVIKEYYLGEIKNVDFVNDPGGASSSINDWVSKNTNDKIKNIVSSGDFDKNSRLVLTNAIYFKGKWEHQFDKDDTKPEDFTLPSGKKIKVPMMKLVKKDVSFKYVESDGVQILEMPYKGDKISMLVLLPRTEVDDPMVIRRFEMEGLEPQTSTMGELESMLDEKKLQEWRSKLKPTTVYIYFPKFSFETDYVLSSYLERMGMEQAFTWPGADFSGIDGTKMLYVDKVLHKAYIDVYEEGTEATATTIIHMGLGAALPSYVIFRADHPFIFMIIERKTGAILFMGKVNNPAK